MLTQDTTPDGVLVRDLRLSDKFGDYTIHHGRALRLNGVTYVVETDAAGDAISPEARQSLDIIYGMMQNSPVSLSAYQRSFVLTRRRTSLEDEYLREIGVDPSDNAGIWAGALNGDMIVFPIGQDAAVRNPEAFKHTVRHEMAHNVDHAKSETLSTSAEWDNATRSDRAVSSQIKGFKQGPNLPNKIMTHSPPFRKGVLIPEAVTTYGATSFSEDFAESLALYARGIIGTGVMDWFGPEERDIWFRDMFPARAAILDQLFPEILEREQRARIRYGQPLVGATA